MSEFLEISMIVRVEINYSISFGTIYFNVPIFSRGSKLRPPWGGGDARLTRQNEVYDKVGLNMFSEISINIRCKTTIHKWEVYFPGRVFTQSSARWGAPRDLKPFELLGRWHSRRKKISGCHNLPGLVEKLALQ